MTRSKTWLRSSTDLLPWAEITLVSSCIRLRHSLRVRWRRCCSLSLAWLEKALGVQGLRLWRRRSCISCRRNLCEDAGNDCPAHGSTSAPERHRPVLQFRSSFRVRGSRRQFLSVFPLTSPSVLWERRWNQRLRMTDIVAASLESASCVRARRRFSTALMADSGSTVWTKTSAMCGKPSPMVKPHCSRRRQPQASNKTCWISAESAELCNVNLHICSLSSDLRKWLSDLDMFSLWL